MHNFYKMLHLDSADAPIGEIQKQCKAIAQSGELPLEHVKKIYSVLSNPEKRAKYNAALRQAEPDFFRQPESLEPAPAAIPTQNFYRLLNLKSADVDERTIQNHFKAAVSRGEIPLETAQQMRDTLFNMGKRSVYNQALRQSDPDFFRPPERMSIDDDTEEPDTQASQSTSSQTKTSRIKIKSATSSNKLLLDQQNKNILLGLFLLGAVAVLFPWINVLGVGMAGYKLTWLNPVLLLLCAWTIWQAHSKDKEVEYTKLVFPLIIIIANHVRFVLSVNKKFSNEFLAATKFSYGIGFYFQIVIIVSICAYLLMNYFKNQQD